MIDVVISDHKKRIVFVIVFVCVFLVVQCFRGYKKYLFGCNYSFPNELHCYSFLYSVIDTDIMCFFPPLEKRCADKEIVCNFTKKNQTDKMICPKLQ